jgi:hypothetical protein
MSNIRCKLQTFAIAAVAASSVSTVLALAAQPATAFVLRGTLTDITFQDENPFNPLPSVTATGSFDYDTVANRYSNINIAMSDGLTFSPADTVGGDSSVFLVQKSSTTENLVLRFFDPLAQPGSVGLVTDPTSFQNCIFTSSCYALLNANRFLQALPEQSIEVTAVPAPPALVGTLLAGMFGLGSRRRKKQLS